MKTTLLMKAVRVAGANPVGAMAVVAIGAIWLAGKAIDASSNNRQIEKRYK